MPTRPVSKLKTTASNKAIIERSNAKLLAKLAEKPAQPPPRPWPFDVDAETLTAWANTTIHHHVAIRATGSLPDLGGPSFPLQLRPATADGIQQATEAAEAYWPNARQFDMIGADLEYKSTVDTEGLLPGMNRLRNAAVIVTFNVTDREPVTPPAQPATPREPEPAASQ